MVVPPRGPSYIAYTLKNGLEVILVPRPEAPTVSVWVWHRVGCKNEYPGTTGAAHWLEHMLFKGSTNYRRGEIDAAIVGVGGTLNAFTDSDFTAYFSTVPREHLDIPLRIEADRLLGATLPSEEIDRERAVVLSEREGNENHPIFRTEEELYALGFREHPYRWDALGSVQDIRGMDRAHLNDFYQRFYGPRNATLVIAGGFEVPATRAKVRRLFEPLRHPVQDPVVKVREPPQRGERRSYLKGPGSTPIVRLAWRSPAIDEPGTPAALILDLYLSGENALYPTSGSRWQSRDHPTARLYQALVDTGLAVRAGSDFPPRVHPALFSVFAQAAPGVGLDQLEERLQSEVERMTATLLPKKELDTLKARMIRGAELAWEGCTWSAFRLGYFRTLGSLAYEPGIFRRALAVRPDEVRDVARQMFRPEARIAVQYEVETAKVPSKGAP